MGTLVLLGGPSGSGKGTLMSYLRAAHPNFFYPTSWTTRAPREGEQEGKSASGKAYHFVTVEKFKEGIERGEFLEWDHHFNNYYGTPAREVQDALADGQVVLQELEVQGMIQLLDKLPRDRVKIIFVTAGAWENLERRVLAREHMGPNELEKRRLRYAEEIVFAEKADFVLVNEDGKLEETQKQLDGIIKKILA
jgi:guanylate kinase